VVAARPSRPCGRRASLGLGLLDSRSIFVDRDRDVHRPARIGRPDDDRSS